MDAAPRWKAAAARAAGIVFGLSVQVVFVVTVPFLYLFLRYGDGHSGQHWFAIDAGLAILFSVVHSTLLLPRVRALITKHLASQLYGSLFSLATCLSLWAMFVLWQTSSAVLWDAMGLSRVLVLGGFYLSWVALFASLSITGFGYQTGWTQWRYWLRRQSLPRREFAELGPYRWLRHPVYCSFLGLIWFTPRMTADHAVLTAVWTAYIFVGSWLKDRRLEFYLGDVYREYAGRVPGYVGMPFGPLAKRRAEGAVQRRSAASIVNPGPKASATHGV
jgi:protein-S-isoprenylcysteine O-methyltransferase Ste14